MAGTNHGLQKGGRLLRLLKALFLLVLVAALGAAGAGWWWLHHPLTLAQSPLDLDIEPGTLPRGVAEAVRKAGVDVEPRLLFAWFRLSGQGKQIRAGSYELTTGITPERLLDKLARGEESLRAVTLVEGWNIRQVRAALGKGDALRQDSAKLSDEDLMKLLGRPGVHPEGRFFPDTYTYSKGSSDVAVLKRAMRAMDKRLTVAWNERRPGIVLKSPEEVLTLASIIEKETGKAADRTLISAVFQNRLRIGMPLQTDPTVIYGMGDAFTGNLHKADLQADTPWNTYVHLGLPPTPISMPGKASLLAAVQPAPGKYLYFVAKGDGTSQFSENLDDHNRAVNKYQRGQ
ncbi:endolytic transglycosylase MltG [Ramlibacter sp. G-1-2-2]|uniref:Endolytic murein transglycosylase n=1 Tax=Ramlibacter agri TaxID=2728837 RepID=A0A848HG33_9BURK|nr:endolytic transglycosylase MltG [Ramlibacter agri]NML48291.1 endolytic transglycosylase MltG [Ramlibacter agri]